MSVSGWLLRTAFLRETVRSYALPLASVSASPLCKLPDRSATLTALQCALVGRGFYSAHCATARPGLGRKSPPLHRRAGSSLPMSYSPSGRCMPQLSSSIMTPGSFSRSLERTFRKRIRVRRWAAADVSRRKHLFGSSKCRSLLNPGSPCWESEHRSPPRSYS